jgi:Phosphotransferase enzyme family
MTASERAVRAALRAGRTQGIRVAEPVVVRDLTNVLVWLAPAPVVARVPVLFPLLRGPDWFVREVELAAFLARAGAPVVPPVTDMDPGPHDVDGFSVSLWRHVDHDPERFDAGAAGRSLRELHEALARYPARLPRYDRLDELRRLLDLLRPSAVASEGELDELRALRARLCAQPPASGERPLHGDAHLANILWTAAGPLWTDLENACSGPVEFDLACIAWRDRPGRDEALAAYGDYEAALVEQVTPALTLLLALWTVVVVERVGGDHARAEARRRIERALAYARR